MADHSMMKLGKKAARHDARTLKLSDYLDPSLNPPDTSDWASKMSNLGMMLNDSLGDCTCAGAGHLIQQWSAANGSQIIVPDSDILKAYQAVGGYVPGDSSTDNGAVEIDVLKYWQKTGIGGYKIGAFVSINPKNKKHLQLANAFFGGAYFGIALPVTAQTQEVWTMPDGGLTGDGAPGSWGGHAVPMGAYDLDGLTVITWGQEKKATWDFVSEYCDEAYCIISPEWTDGTKPAPSGFNLTQLQSDLAGVQN